jgi:hypothetical protein
MDGEFVRTFVVQRLELGVEENAVMEVFLDGFDGGDVEAWLWERVFDWELVVF